MEDGALYVESGGGSVVGAGLCGGRGVRERVGAGVVGVEGLGTDGMGRGMGIVKGASGKWIWSSPLCIFRVEVRSTLQPCTSYRRASLLIRPNTARKLPVLVSCESGEDIDKCRCFRFDETSRDEVLVKQGPKNLEFEGARQSGRCNDGVGGGAGGSAVRRTIIDERR